MSSSRVLLAAPTASYEALALWHKACAAVVISSELDFHAVYVRTCMCSAEVAHGCTLMVSLIDNASVSVDPY